jgi:prophage regulatory protein
VIEALDPHSVRLLRVQDVLRMVALSRSTLYHHVRRGEFPRPLSIGPRAVRWRSDEVHAWLNARTDARSAA